MEPIVARDLLNNDLLKLSLISGRNGLDNLVRSHEFNKPALTLAGYFDYFVYDRIQILGRTEISYLDTLTKERLMEIIEKLFSYEIPCIIITTNIPIQEELKTISNKKSIPLLKTGLDTTDFIKNLTLFLEEKLAPTTSKHGVLMDVYGVGVLITGKSGVGKSECALELIERGHILVADDVVDIRRKGQVLEGYGSKLIRHHMEIRGIGIIDIKNLFGIGAIKKCCQIDQIIKLEIWNEDKEYDRLGLDENFETILGVKIPSILIPVQPGRNLAIIIEVAAINNRAKKIGINSAKDFNRKLIEHIKGKL